jgi:hypothetical protein
MIFSLKPFSWSYNRFFFYKGNLLVVILQENGWVKGYAYTADSLAYCKVSEATCFSLNKGRVDQVDRKTWKEKLIESKLPPGLANIKWKSIGRDKQEFGDDPLGNEWIREAVIESSLANDIEQ